MKTINVLAGIWLLTVIAGIVALFLLAISALFMLLEAKIAVIILLSLVIYYGGSFLLLKLAVS